MNPGDLKPVLWPLVICVLISVVGASCSLLYEIILSFVIVASLFTFSLQL